MIVCNHLDDQALSKLLMKSTHQKKVRVAHKKVRVAHKKVRVAHKSVRFSSYNKQACKPEAMLV